MVAYELDPAAAECAQAVVKLTGYSNQIQIEAGDILAAGPQGQADLAIAEILGPGLRGENGPAVIAALAHRVTHVIPDGATLYAVDIGPATPRSESSWQQVARVDLTDPVVRVGGTFRSIGAGIRSVRVRADIMAGGQKIVAGLGTDSLTHPVTVGRPVAVPHVGTPIAFAYDIGPAPYTTPDSVQVRL